MKARSKILHAWMENNKKSYNQIAMEVKTSKRTAQQTTNRCFETRNLKKKAKSESSSEIRDKNLEKNVEVYQGDSFIICNRYS